MKCPRCQKENGSDFPVRLCRCGYKETNQPKPVPVSQPGHMLSRIIPAMFKHEGCGCEAFAHQMNVWGLRGCVRRHGLIRKTLAAKLAGFPKWPNVPAVYALPIGATLYLCWFRCVAYENPKRQVAANAWLAVRLIGANRWSKQAKQLSRPAGDI